MAKIDIVSCSSGSDPHILGHLYKCMHDKATKDQLYIYAAAPMHARQTTRDFVNLADGCYIPGNSDWASYMVDVTDEVTITWCNKKDVHNP